jgi:hypothetical protein
MTKKTKTTMKGSRRMAAWRALSPRVNWKNRGT